MVTDGYKYLMGEIKMTYGDGDPWGTTINWLFCLAEVAWIEFGELMPDFRPSPIHDSRSDLYDYEHHIILDGIDYGNVTSGDIRTVYKVMHRYDDLLRAAGLNY